MNLKFRSKYTRKTGKKNDYPSRKVSAQSHAYLRLLAWIRQVDKRMKNQIKLFKSENGQGDLLRIEKGKAEFRLWKSYYVVFLEEYPDLVYEFTDEILEKDEYRLRKEKRFLTLPLNIRKHAENLDGLIDAMKVLEDFSAKTDLMEEKEKKNFLSTFYYFIPNAGIRNFSDQDYRITLLPGAKNLELFQKKSLETILLFSKQLKRVHELLNQEASWLLKEETPLLPSKKLFVESGFMEFVQNMTRRKPLFNQGGNNFSDQEVADILQHNFSLANKLEEISDKAKKKYFKLLDKTLFKIANEIRQAGINYRESINENFSELEVFPELKAWGSIYEDLFQVLTKFMEEFLNIIPLEPEIGDPFDPSIHIPFTEPEPAIGLPNDSIKSVVNLGFMWKEEVVKAVDIITVKNT